MCPGAFQSRALISYFSESRYSSRLGNGADSQSSYPEYIPHRPDRVVASAARMRKPARSEVCRIYGLMSGVLTKKLGRKKSQTGRVVSSVMYSVSSRLVLRQMK